MEKRNIQANMTDEEKLEFRTKNRLPVFCEHSYINFFNTWCRVCEGRCTSDRCKKCTSYVPTLENK